MPRWTYRAPGALPAAGHHPTDARVLRTPGEDAAKAKAMACNLPEQQWRCQVLRGTAVFVRRGVFASGVGAWLWRAGMLCGARVRCVNGSDSPSIQRWSLLHFYNALIALVFLERERYGRSRALSNATSRRNSCFSSLVELSQTALLLDSLLLL